MYHSFRKTSAPLFIPCKKARKILVVGLWCWQKVNIIRQMWDNPHNIRKELENGYLAVENWLFVPFYGKWGYEETAGEQIIWQNAKHFLLQKQKVFANLFERRFFIQLHFWLRTAFLERFSTKKWKVKSEKICLYE